LTALSQENVSIQKQQYEVFKGIEWDTAEWSNWLNQSIINQLLGIGNIQTPIGNIPLGRFLANIYQSIACMLPSWKGQVQGLNIDIPTRITIKLPCKEVYVDFSKDFNKVINEVTTKFKAYIPDWFERCLYHPTDPGCVKQGYSYLSFKYQGFNDIYLQAESYKKYAQMTNNQINEEIEKDVKAISQEIFPTVTKDNKTVYNTSVLKANLGAIKEAGSSTGKLAYPDEKQIKGKPEELKKVYAYVVAKQAT
jgi:hypothetical protein